MSEFTFSCPRCGKPIQCDIGYCGTEINCPACQQPITVPTQAANSPATPTIQTGSAAAGKSPKSAKRNALLAVTVVAVSLFLIVGAGLLWVWASHNKPVAWWRAEGNARDSAGHDDGKLVGNPIFSRGIIGEAFEFDSSGSYVKIPPSASLNPGGQLTIEFWMKADPGNAMTSFQGLVTSAL